MNYIKIYICLMCNKTNMVGIYIHNSMKCSIWKMKFYRLNIIQDGKNNGIVANLTSIWQKYWVNVLLMIFLDEENFLVQKYQQITRTAWVLQ